MRCPGSRAWLDTFLPQKTLLAPRSRPSRRGDSRSRSRPARRINRARALATRMTRSPPDAPSPLDVARLELTLASRDDELARARATADELRAALGRAEEKVKTREADIDAARARAERLEATVADLDVRAKVLVEREVALRSHLRATETALERATSEAKTLAADAAREAAAAIPSPRDQHRPLDRSIMTLAGAIEEEIRRVERRVEDAERLAAERAESSRAVRERFETLVDALDADLKNLRGVYKREEKREKALRRAAKRIAELESERAPEERTTDLG